MDTSSFFGLTFTPTDLFDSQDRLPNISPDDKILQVNPAAGDGFAREIIVGEHSSLLFLDMVLREETTVQKTKHADPAEISVSAFCVLSPGAIAIIDNDDVTFDAQQTFPFILFTLPGTAFDFKIAAAVPARIILINCPSKKLQEGCKVHDQHLCSLLNTRSGEAHCVVLDENADVLRHKVLELYAHARRKYADMKMLETQTRSVMLELIRTILGEHRISEANERIMYGKMNEVKQVLSGHLESKLPSLSMLAQKVAVSESTLKRNFKQFFGTSIYEYYLQSKMEWARHLFEDQSLSVKEVAYRLGYEKPSSFIKIFKRIYHYPPGTLKRRVSPH